LPWPAVLVVSELPPGRLPVRLFTVPVTEPTWGSELVWGVLVPETRPAADPRPGMEPETELRPGRELLVLLRLLAGPLVVAIGVVCWVVSAELVSAELAAAELHGAPTSPAAAEASGPAMGMPGSSQRIPVADDPPRACASPLTDDVGESARDTDCASAGAAMPTVRMAAQAAPPSNIRQLYTKHSISILGNGIGRYLRIHTAGRTNLEPGNLIYPVKLTAGLTAGRPSGGLGASGPDEIPVCAPELVTRLT
jgi:hypothetical protein